MQSGEPWNISGGFWREWFCSPYRNLNIFIGILGLLSCDMNRYWSHLSTGVYFIYLDTLFGFRLLN